MNFLNHSLKLVFIAFIASLFALTACEGPEGPQGPSGADGSPGVAGTNGQDGAQGPAGPAGQNGDAGVKSYTFKLASSDYTGAEATVNIAGITQDIFDNGLVMAYVNRSGWRALPFVFVNGNNTFLSLFFTINVGEIKFTGENALNAPAPYAGDFRVVVIPGTPGKKATNLDLTDYEAVAKYYNLPLD